MVRIPKAYLDTSVFNFVFDDSDPCRRLDTLKFFERIKEGRYAPCTSRYAIDELSRAPSPKRELMLALPGEYGMEVFPADAEAERLADVYIARGIIPPRFLIDACHIAIAAINGVDFIVSLNFRHVVKRKTIEMTEMVNYIEGYKKVGIYSPAEVIEDE
ncbi:MAG: hypothetical protein LBR38_07000 [Synergistaceae bacterium]|nr:hypothetical protein [Synergistaceae bacterium]